MNSVQFDRFNTLSELVLNESATKEEVDEFRQLLLLWNSRVELGIRLADEKTNEHDSFSI